jgi:hypothetical protein
MADDTVTGTRVAIKKIHDVVVEGAKLSDTMRVLREIKLLKFFRHENVRAAAA